MISPKKSRPCDSCRARRIKCVMDSTTNLCTKCLLKNVKCTFTIKGTSEVYQVDELHPPSLIELSTHNPLQYSYNVSNMGNLKGTISYDYSTSSQYIGSTSAFDSMFVSDETPQEKNVRSVAKDVYFRILDIDVKLYKEQLRDVDAIERLVWPYGKLLIETFFNIIHPLLPILDRTTFVERYTRNHREIHPLLLGGIYYLSLIWWDSDSRFNPGDEPDEAKIKLLGQLIIKSYNEHIMQPSIELVQAGIIILMCNVFQTSNWLVSNQIISMLEQIGLFIDCKNWDIPSWEIGVRRRLAWAVYLECHWQALIHSKSCSVIPGVNWFVSDLDESDFPDSKDEITPETLLYTEKVLGNNIFLQSVKLAKILRDIIPFVISPSHLSMGESLGDQASRAQELKERLNVWYSQIPQTLHEIPLHWRKLNSSKLIFLSYHALITALNRKFLTMIHGSESPLDETFRHEAGAQITEAIQLVSGFLPEHINACWYSSSSYNMATIGIFAAMLYKTSSDQESERYKTLVLDYRWSLLVRSKGIFKTGAALDMLDSVLRYLPEFNSRE